MGVPRLHAYPAMARFKVRDVRGGEVRFEADIKVGIAGRRGTFTACVSGVDIPAMLCMGAPEALRGQLDFERDISTIRGPGADIPLKVNDMGHYVLSVVAPG